jgi:hypothetical protein
MSTTYLAQPAPIGPWKVFTTVGEESDRKYRASRLPASTGLVKRPDVAKARLAVRGPIRARRWRWVLGVPAENIRVRHRPSRRGPRLPSPKQSFPVVEQRSRESALFGEPSVAANTGSEFAGPQPRTGARRARSILRRPPPDIRDDCPSRMQHTLRSKRRLVQSRRRRMCGCCGNHSEDIDPFDRCARGSIG